MKLLYREFFSENVSSLGHQICENHGVTQVNLFKNRLSAKVSNERVTIQNQNGQITNMECTCSYSKKGYYCMHMAALCIYLEQIAHVRFNESSHESKEKDQKPHMHLLSKKTSFLSKELTHQKVRELDRKLFPNLIEDDEFFDTLISYADLLIEDGENIENVLSLMEKYKRSYSIFEWVIKRTQQQDDPYHVQELIEEAIRWSKRENNIGYLKKFYHMRRDFYHNL